MLNYFVMLVPSLVGVEVFKKFNKNISRKEEIIFYLIQLLLTNISATFVTVKFWGCTYAIEQYLLAVPLVAVKYAIISMFITIFISMAINLLINVIRVELSVNEKKLKKNTKINKKCK